MKEHTCCVQTLFPSRSRSRNYNHSIYFALNSSTAVVINDNHQSHAKESTGYECNNMDDFLSKYLDYYIDNNGCKMANVK